MKTKSITADFDSRQRHYLRLGREEMLRLVKEYFNSEKSDLPRIFKINEICGLNDINLSCICIIEENRPHYQKYQPQCYKLLKNIIDNINNSSLADYEEKQKEKQRRDNLTMMKNQAGLPLEFHSTSMFENDIEMTNDLTYKNIAEKLKLDDYVEMPINVLDNSHTSSLFLISLCNFLIEKIHAKDPDNYHKTSIRYFRFSDFLQQVDMRRLNETNEYLLELRKPDIVLIEGLDLSVLTEEKKYLFKDMMKQRKLMKKKTFYTEA